MMAGVLNWFWFAGAGCACAWLVVMVAYYKRRNILKNEMWQLLLISVIAILWDRMEGLVCGFCDSFRDIGSAVCRTFSNLCRNQFSDIGCTVYLLQEGYDAGVS